MSNSILSIISTGYKSRKEIFLLKNITLRLFFNLNKIINIKLAASSISKEIRLKQMLVCVFFLFVLFTIRRIKTKFHLCEIQSRNEAMSPGWHQWLIFKFFNKINKSSSSSFSKHFFYVLCPFRTWVITDLHYFLSFVAISGSSTSHFVTNVIHWHTLTFTSFNMPSEC